VNAFVLKLIALTSMVIDHTGATFDFLPFWFRIIGRLAFPLYVFLIAEGCRHTKSMPKLLLRLFLFALLSEIPFDMVIHRGDINFLYETNIFYTLFLGTAVVYAYQSIQKIRPSSALFFSILILVAAMLLAEYLMTDYASIGVAFIFTMYVIQRKKLRLIIMAVFCCLSLLEIWLGMLGKILEMIPSVHTTFLSPFAGIITPDFVTLAVVCLLTVPLAAMYNGKRGPGLKWFFYIAYPAHLLLLALIVGF
jgi:hypothetical protein